MQLTVKLPRLGDTVDAVVVIEWAAVVGVVVNEGDTLLTVETDKVGVDVPSPVAGTVVKHLVAPEDEIATGTAVCLVEG